MSWLNADTDAHIDSDNISKAATKINTSDVLSSEEKINMLSNCGSNDKSVSMNHVTEAVEPWCKHCLSPCVLQHLNSNGLEEVNVQDLGMD